MTQTGAAQYFSSGKIYAFVRKVPPLVDEFGTPLDFIAQPLNRRVKVHETAYFAARAIDATSYQWFKNGSPIPGANSRKTVKFAYMGSASGPKDSSTAARSSETE